MIPEDKVNEILALMSSNDMDARMAALVEGKKIFAGHFANCTTIEQFAAHASSLEMAYNLVRNGLKREAVRLTDVQRKEIKGAMKAANKPATPKEKKKKTPAGQSPLEYLKKNGIDISQLMKGTK